MTEFKKQYSQQFGFGFNELDSNRRQQQQLVDNSIVSNARKRDSNIAALAQFSTTAAGWLDEYNEAKRERQEATELLQAAGMDAIGHGDIKDQEIFEEGENQINGQYEDAQEAVKRIREKNPDTPYSHLRHLLNASGKPSWDTVKSHVRQVMGQYRSTMQKIMSDPNREYTMGEGDAAVTFRLGDLDKDSEEGKARWAFALARERERFLIETGLNKVNPRLLAPHAMDVILHDQDFLTKKEAEISFRAGEDDIKQANDNYLFNDNPNLNDWFEVAKVTTDANGNPLGYKGAHKKLQAILLDKLKSGDLSSSDINKILDTEIKGGRYDGETLRTAFPNVYGINMGKTGKGVGTFISVLEQGYVDADRDNRQLEAAKRNEIIAIIKDPEALKKAAADAEISEKEYIEKHMNSWDSIPRTIKELYDRKYAEPAAPDEVSRTVEYLETLYKANKLRPDKHAMFINRLPPDLREDWYTKAEKTWKNRRTGEYDGNWKVFVGDMKRRFKIDDEADISGSAKPIHDHLLKLYDRKFIERLEYWEKQGRTDAADIAADEALKAVKTEWEQNGGDEVYTKDPKTGEVSGGKYSRSATSGTDAAGEEFQIFEFPLFKKDPYDPYSETSVINRTQLLKNYYGKDGVLTSGELMTKAEAENYLKIDKKAEWTAKVLGLTAIEYINSQRELHGFDPLEDKLELKSDKKEKVALINTPSVNTSTRALASHNREKFDPISVPGGWGYTLESTVPGSENIASALIEVVNGNWDIIPEDIDDAQNIIESTNDWDTLYTSLIEQGIDGHELNKCAFKYGVKHADGTPVTCIRPTLQIA